MRYAWNVGMRYKVQCGHADSSEWNVWYAWNVGIRYKVHYANNVMLTDKPCVPPFLPSSPGWVGPSLSDRRGFGPGGRGLRGASCPIGV